MHKSGFTMLEMLMVIVIAGIISSIGYFVLTSAGAHHRLQSTSKALRHDMAYARQLSKEKGTNYGIRFLGKQWQIYYVEAGGDTIVETEYDIPHDVSLGVTAGVNKKVTGTGSPPNDGIDFTGDRIVFMQRGATPGTIYMNNGEESRALDINILGNTRYFQWDGSSWAQRD